MLSSYVRVRRLVGGTYTPGADWAAQFDSDPTVVVSALPTQVGEIFAPEGTVAASSADLALSKTVLSADFTITALQSAVVADSLEVPAGVHLEVGAGGVLEIT